MDLSQWLDLLKVVVGVAYIFLEYYQRREMWLASVIMPCIGIWLFYEKGVYADAAINVYYLLIAVYGFWQWSRGRAAAPSRPAAERGREGAAALLPSHVGLRRAAVLTAVWGATWLFIAWVLATFTDSTVVWLDSLTTSLSIVAMYMLARKYVEQWLIWFVVDAISVYLYYYKGIYFSGTLYLFYTTMALAGYRKWLRSMHNV